MIGNPYPGQGPPQLSAGAFQSSPAAAFCYYGSGPDGIGIPCAYQYIAEIDPTGTNLLWDTYVTGTYGATPGAIALDAENNVIVAGTTNSTDYPVTAGALQAAYAPSVPSVSTSGFSYTVAPPPTGYVTKLNPTGSALVWSTYFGGSFMDNIAGMSLDASGEIYVSGLAGSNDLPGLSETPSGCQPSQGQALGFVAHITAGGSQTVGVELACGRAHFLPSVAGFVLRRRQVWLRLPISRRGLPRRIL